MYKHRTNWELLTGKCCWKGHFSKTLNNSIPTPLSIRTVHKYPFSFCFPRLGKGPFYNPFKGGRDQETSLASGIRAQYKLFVAMKGSAQLTSLHSLALEILKPQKGESSIQLDPLVAHQSPPFLLMHVFFFVLTEIFGNSCYPEHPNLL